MFCLKEKVILVTGGNGGIGLGMAKALAKAGAKVVIWGTNSEKNKQAKEEMDLISADNLVSKVDVSDEKQVDENVNAIVAKYGRLDGVFANAALGGIAAPITNTKTSDFRKIMAVNLEGVFFTLRAVSRVLVKQNTGGSIVIISSLAGEIGIPYSTAYASSKGAITAMGKGLAGELARNNIRVNVIIPGWIDTDMTHNSLELKGFQTKVLNRIPLRRWGTPTDFGGIAVYLCSKEAAYHTGDVITIDGAYSKF